jgi:hypothetical protein
LRPPDPALVQRLDWAPNLGVVNRAVLTHFDNRADQLPFS